MVNFSLPWQPRNHAFDANLLEIEGSRVEKLVQKLIFHFFSKSSTATEQKESFLSVVPQKMPEIWPCEVWHYSGIVLQYQDSTTQ